MKITTLADKFFKSLQVQSCCAGCGADNFAKARFCGKCGLRLRSESYLAKPGPKEITAVAIFIFLFTIFLTVAMLSLQKPVYARNQVFADVPLDHQVYSECSKLLAYDGIMLRTKECFSAYEEITVDEFNQALLAAVRYNRCALSESILVRETNLHSALVEGRIKALAELTGRMKQFRRLEKKAFSDLTRFNLLSLIEEIFMR